MGSIADKLTYLGNTKSRFMKAMTDLGYEVTGMTTLRQAVDMLVAEAIKKQAEDFDVSDLPEYWRESMRDALAHTMMLGDDYVHHLVSTDNHYDVNQKKSVDIQRLLYGTGLFSKVINLGDLTDGGSTSAWATQSAHAIADYHDIYGDDLLFAIGNHDDCHSGSSSYLYPLISGNTSLKGNDVQNFNYYFDDDEHKIRYVVANTPSSASASTQEKIASIFTAPSGYHVMLLTHYSFYSFISDFYGDERAPYDLVGDQGIFAKVLLNRIPFIGVFAGHEHSDAYVDYLNCGLVHQLTLNNDSYGVKDAAPWPKTVGTNTEQAVTIVSVNPKTQDVQCYRIGKTCRLGRTWGWKYSASLTPEFKKNIWISGDGTGTIASGSDSQFFYTAALNYRDGNGNAINRYVVNRGEANIYWRYELQYDASGNVVNRASVSTGEASAYSKVKRAKIPSNRYAEKCLLCIETQNGTANENDFTLAESLSDYDLGWDFSSVPWVDNCLWQSSGDGASKSTSNGYAGSKFVHVKPNTKYRFSVDDAGWSFQYAIVLAFNENGDYIAQLASPSAAGATQIVFTTTAKTKYVLISVENLSGYTNKARLEEASP